jgi:hypothetical protein
MYSSVVVNSVCPECGRCLSCVIGWPCSTGIRVERPGIFEMANLARDHIRSLDA